MQQKAKKRNEKIRPIKERIFFTNDAREAAMP